MNDQRSLGRVFVEGMALGAGILVATGVLKLAWNAATSATADDEEDEDDLILSRNEDEEE